MEGILTAIRASTVVYKGLAGVEPPSDSVAGELAAAAVPALNALRACTMSLRSALLSENPTECRWSWAQRTWSFDPAP